MFKRSIEFFNNSILIRNLTLTFEIYKKNKKYSIFKTKVRHDNVRTKVLLIKVIGEKMFKIDCIKSQKKLYCPKGSILEILLTFIRFGRLVLLQRLEIHKTSVLLYCSLLVRLLDLLFTLKQVKNCDITVLNCFFH